MWPPTNATRKYLALWTVRKHGIVARKSPTAQNNSQHRSFSSRIGLSRQNNPSSTFHVNLGGCDSVDLNLFIFFTKARSCSESISLDGPGNDYSRISAKCHHLNKGSISCRNRVQHNMERICRRPVDNDMFPFLSKIFDIL